MPSTPTGAHKSAPLAPTFRLAGQADIAILVALMRQFNAIDAYPFDEHITRSALEQFIGDPTLGRLWLIQEDDIVIGYLALTFGYSFEYHGRDAFIDELYILPSHRGQGIGTRAMQFVIEAAPGLGVHALHLEVEQQNSAAQRLYRKAGFENHERYLLNRWVESE
jgi:ribosomal protein S18 acetylase RimI-like enzyme